MAAAIQPNTMLTCVENDSFQGYVVEVGRVYTCEDVLPYEYFRGQFAPCTTHGETCDGGGVKLVEVSIPREFYWCTKCFVPAGRRGAFDSLLKVEPIREGV